MGPGWKPRRPVFSERGSNLTFFTIERVKNLNQGVQHRQVLVVNFFIFLELIYFCSVVVKSDLVNDVEAKIAYVNC